MIVHSLLLKPRRKLEHQNRPYRRRNITLRHRLEIQILVNAQQIMEYSLLKYFSQVQSDKEPGVSEVRTSATRLNEEQNIKIENIFDLLQTT